MTIEDIDKEINHLMSQRDRIIGSIDAMIYIKGKLQLEAAASAPEVPPPAPIEAEVA